MDPLGSELSQALLSLSWPRISVPAPTTARVAVLKLFGFRGPIAYSKIIENPKKLCLCGLYIMILLCLQIETILNYYSLKSAGLVLVIYSSCITIVPKLST